MVYYQIKAPQFYTDLGLQKTVLNPLTNGKIQGLFKATGCFSRTFQGKFYFHGLFKTVMYIQVLSSLCKPQGGGGGTLIFSYIPRPGHFFGVQIF